ncbi:MAG: hypothetical protein WA734_20140 [Candidatus Acidiferrales bacterium]
MRIAIVMALAMLGVCGIANAQKNPWSGVRRLRIEDVRDTFSASDDGIVSRGIEVHARAGKKVWFTLSCTLEDGKVPPDFCPSLVIGKTYSVTVRESADGVFISFDAPPTPNKEMMFKSAAATKEW